MEQEISGLKVCRQLLLLQTLIQIRPQVVIFTGLLQRCKQWGKILGDTVNLKIITFPVPFNESFGGVALFNGDPVAAAEYATITDVTNTNFKIYMYANNAGTGYANANIFYLFLGAQQQWGYSTSTGVTFPIAFRECYAVVSNAHSNTTGNADHYHLLSWTATGAAFGYWNMSFYGTLYIALGVE